MVVGSSCGQTPRNIPPARNLQSNRSENIRSGRVSFPQPNRPDECSRLFCLCVSQVGDSLETDDLYDDVLTGSVDGESTLGKQESKEDVKPVVESGDGKRFSVYVGNFNWVSRLRRPGAQVSACSDSLTSSRPPIFPPSNTSTKRTERSPAAW